MRAATDPDTIRLILEEYGRGNNRRAKERGWWLASDVPFNDLLVRVGRAEIWNKRHPHQRRLSQPAIKAGIAALLQKEAAIAAAPDFHELWTIVGATFEPIRGLGELAAYDAADRLRHRLGLESPHLIYLHAGARKGARILAGGRLPKESAWAIQRWEVPEGLRGLSTHEIEDILCIYKDEFLLSPAEFLARPNRNRTPCDPDGPPSGC